MNRAGNDFLEAFTAYVKWRLNPKPPDFDQQNHVVKFGRYLESIGAGKRTKLHKSLMVPMSLMLGPRSPGGGPKPKPKPPDGQR